MPISKERDLNNRTGLTVWFTGLSGSGKTTLCRAVENLLREQDLKVEVPDGDVIRKHLCKGPGFSREDRNENVSRIAFVAAIAPFRAARAEAAEKIGAFLMCWWTRRWRFANSVTPKASTVWREAGLYRHRRPV